MNHITNEKKSDAVLSLNALSFAIMTMVKTNQLANEFSNNLGFRILNELLEGPCMSNAQIAYNVITTLWILSYHERSLEFIADYNRGLIEKVSKILDQFSWEKIVRIMMMLFNNLKDHPVCQEHLSDIDCLNLVIKLQNRHWVDEDIHKVLETLFNYFDENQQEFSSMEKLKNQVGRRQLRWGPCHTEKFWQENHVFFDNIDNLKIINILANDCLLDEVENRVKAVACFDLGEFARYFPHGKDILERHNVKSKMTKLM